MSEYDIRPGGALKLKGKVIEGGIVKKKKKKSKKDGPSEAEPDKTKEKLLQESTDTRSPSGSTRNSPAIESSSTRKTDAERRFEEVQRKRLAERISKVARKTHKDRVAEFNAQLETLSEHHDIPKVGPG